MRRVGCPVLVGRDDELGLLTELLADAMAGRGSAAFVVGEPGIGKSRLLTALADIARSRDMAVLRGRAAASPVPTPCRPLAEAFLSATRGRELDPECLSRFTPALPLLLPGRVEAFAGGESSIVLLGEATLALVERCAGRAGTLVILDDLHWADDETCEVIDYLSDKLDTTQVALVGSLRMGESSAAERLVRTLTARRHATAVDLRRLGPDAVEALVAASLGTADVPDALRSTVCAASGGVPFLAEEYLAALIDAGALWRDADRWRTAESIPNLVPPSFASVVADRLAALTPAARRVIAVAAVIGDDIDLELVAPVAELDGGATIAALREGVRAQLVDELSTGSGKAFRFRHGLSRAAVLDDLAAPERRDIAAAALSGFDGRLTDLRSIETVASLALAAGDTGRAVAALVGAADAARRQCAWVSARLAAETAAELAASPEQQLAADEVLLDTLVHSGDAARAAEVGARVLGALEQCGAGAARRAGVHLRLAEAAVTSTDWARAERHAAEAGALAAGTAGPPDVRVDLLHASIALGRHRTEEAMASARRAMDAAAAENDPGHLADAAMLLGRAQRVHDIESARQAFGQAFTAARRCGSPILVARAAHELATIDILEAGPADRLLEARRLAEDAGALALLAVCDTHLAILHWLHFDLDASRAAATRAIEAAERFQLGLLVPAAGLMLAGPNAVLGRSEGVLDTFRRYQPLMDAEIEATHRGHVLAFLGLATEDRAAAVEQLERAMGLAPPLSDVARAPHCGVWALALAVDASPRAASLAGQLDADPGIVGVTRGLVDLAVAVVAGREGDGVEASRRVETGLTHLHGAVWLRAMGLRLAAEAAVADGWGDPAAWLRSAHDFFDAHGITAPAEACRRLLRQAGAPSPRTPANGQHPELARLGVTARETEVLELVAAGLSNREIAERLVLSVRTVEKHVERLMMKTDSTNRTQLAALASRLGGAAPAST